MNYLKLENFLVNLSFFLLFASMLYYWIQLVFFSNIFKPESDSATPLVRSKPYNITYPSYSSVLGHVVAITKTFDTENRDADKLGLTIFPQIEDLNRYPQSSVKSKGRSSIPSLLPIFPLDRKDPPILQPGQGDHRPNRYGFLVGSLYSPKEAIQPTNETKLSKLLKKITNIHYGQLFVFLANLTMFFLLLDRWLESGHFPLSNLYESLIFLSWSLTSINLWIEKIQPSGLKTFFPSIFNFSFLTLTKTNHLGFDSWLAQRANQRTISVCPSSFLSFLSKVLRRMGRIGSPLIWFPRRRLLSSAWEPSPNQTKESNPTSMNMNWWNYVNSTSLNENIKGPYNGQPESSSGIIKAKKKHYSTLLVKEPISNENVQNENLQSLMGNNRESTNKKSTNRKDSTTPLTFADSVLLLRRDRRSRDRRSRDRSRNYFDVGPSDPTERSESAVQQIIDVQSLEVDLTQSERYESVHPTTSVLMNGHDEVMINSSISSKIRTSVGLDHPEPSSGNELISPNSNNNQYHRIRNSENPNKTNKINYIFGGIITPIALIIHAFASFSLPSELREATSLVPALQSNWLIMHVTVIMLSYAALLAGCLFSLVFLLFDIFFSATLNNTIDFKEFTKFNYIFMNSKNPFNRIVNFETQSILNRLGFSPTLNVDSIVDSQNQRTISDCPLAWSEGPTKGLYAGGLHPKNVNEIDRIVKIKKPAKTTTDIKDLLDNLSYRTIGIGFLLLTIGIFSGAVWANEAWGSYWSWDPKETWALITWLIFAIYLHTRLQLSWPRKKAAMIACSGFVVVWICYLGVNLLGQGLHSYGFISGTGGGL